MSSSQFIAGRLEDLFNEQAKNTPQLTGEQLTTRLREAFHRIDGPTPEFERGDIVQPILGKQAATSEEAVVVMRRLDSPILAIDHVLKPTDLGSSVMSLSFGHVIMSYSVDKDSYFENLADLTYFEKVGSVFDDR